jgi:putative ABC transport system permease protein
MQRPVLIFGVFLFMIFFAGFTVWQRILEKRLIPSIEYFFMSLATMLMVGLIIPYFVNAWIIGLDPWYQPRYLLPIAGMVLGNSMNGITLSVNAFQERLTGQREAIVARLALGATEEEATREELRYAIHQGMTPQLNAMAAVGLVFIPGMMTGQVLAGAEPILAAMYQIIVMLMLLGASSMGTVMIVLLVRRRLFRRDLFLLGGDIG